MKLSADQINFIETVVKTGQSINIEAAIIEPDMVRAIDEARTVVLYQNKNVPEMPFGSVGINRMGSFMSRLEIAKSRDKFSIDTVMEAETAYAKSLIMKGAGLRIDYRSANPSTIQAPRQINDNLIYRVALNSEAVALLQKGQAAMGEESVSIVADDDGVSFELVDTNSDMFRHTFADGVELLDDSAVETFTHRYPAKTLLSLFKQNPDGYFEIGEKGILSITVNGLDIYVLPQV